MPAQVPVYEGTLPARNQAQPAFDNNVQDLIAYLPPMVTGVNEVAEEVNENTLIAAAAAETAVEQAGIATTKAEATAADRIQTGQDATATAADRIQTGQDATATEGFRDEAEQFRDEAQAAVNGTVVTVNDTTPAPLQDKLIAGDGIELTLTTPGANEALVAKVKFASASDLNTGTDQTKALNSKIARENQIYKSAVIAASGQTAIDFGSIPAWVTELKVCFVQSSTSSTSNWIVQLGDSGGIEPTGYTSASANIPHGSNPSIDTAASGFNVYSTLAAYTVDVTMTIIREPGTNKWLASHSGRRTDSSVVVLGAGDKELSGDLTQIRITTITGTPTFDNGTFFITGK